MNRLPHPTPSVHFLFLNEEHPIFRPALDFRHLDALNAHVILNLMRPTAEASLSNSADSKSPHRRRSCSLHRATRVLDRWRETERMLREIFRRTSSDRISIVWLGGTDSGPTKLQSLPSPALAAGMSHLFFARSGGGSRLGKQLYRRLIPHGDVAARVVRLISPGLKVRFVEQATGAGSRKLGAEPANGIQFVEIVLRNEPKRSRI